MYAVSVFSPSKASSRLFLFVGPQFLFKLKTPRSDVSAGRFLWWMANCLKQIVALPGLFWRKSEVIVLNNGIASRLFCG